MASSSEQKYFNPLSPGAFCQKHIFGHFGDFLAGYHHVS